MTATPIAALREPVATGPVGDVRLEEILRALDPGFLRLLGWDWGRRVITFPREHPVIGLPDCPVPNCPLAITVATRPMCWGCLQKWRATELPLEEFLRIPKAISKGVGQIPCSVDGCERPQTTATARLCESHHLQRTQRLGGLGLEEFLVHPKVVGLAGLGPCLVASCYLDRVGRQYPYCKAHIQRLRTAREAPGFDEAAWRLTERAVCSTREASLRGLPDRLVAEVLYGLWSRVESGFKTRPECLRPLYDRLRAHRIRTVDEVTDPAAAGYSREQVMMIRASQVALRRLNATPETERVKDVWDMTVFGHTGALPFTSLVQEPLREAMKVWVYDDLPRRRNKNAVHHARAVISAMALLSESLRLQRPDRGMAPAEWGRGDIVAFSNRMGHLTAIGKLSATRRLAFTRFVRRVLLRFRTLGLAAPGGQLEGMPVDFAIWPEDMPDEPEDTEAGRDLPEAVMRELCANLDRLQTTSNVETRVATELLIDTGRRPDEVFTLPMDCLEQDPDGSPVLIYDNHKAYRLGRRLPIGGETAALIRQQQQRVRERFPTTETTRLKLLPRPKTNPEGTKEIKDISTAHREWVDSLPDLVIPLVTVEAGTPVTRLVPFDKSRIFPYAYRHCYAQRHADAGVAPDVLKELMDHRLITTTQGYYRVGAERRREAVDRVTALQFDRHGNRVWRTAQSLLDSEHVRRAIGEVATPYGVCREPSNVAAGRHACPLRFRCLGCEHFSTDVSYLPDLQAHLTDLLRSRERLMSAFEADDWARTQAMPTDEEIRRVRRLIDRVTADLDDLTAEDRAQIEQAVTLVRRGRTVHLGMPRVGQPLPDVRPPRTHLP
ncbi:tyrosine-type recombinase/integrase [Streptomyces decoyicus]|uniref:Tyrosine-type recombinase/integrase n=1 Tax=Streptomyces decoyicus TaxID=249567 RepID=A0ABZ1FCY0_9ACTN|nr:tyrosine-type recombinase/integrase [Streptomyces decoyicus]WSB68217.1 tyrosine-type recombinase/integrase [Streptomyces decoyicus]